MFKTIAILCLVYSVSCIEGIPKFRYDYSFSKEAGGWMKLHLVPATWNDAYLICHAEGAVLASPLTWQLRSEMVKLATGHDYHHPVNTIFTGVHTTFSKGVYASVEGIAMSGLSISWSQGEPDNYENSESCLAMHTTNNGSMSDVKCNDVYPFICYKKKTNTPLISGCGTQDPGYIFKSTTGSCYKFHRSGMTWPGAYRTCMAEGGHLIIINSDVEAQVLKDIYAMNPESTIFAKFPYASIGTYLNPGDGGYWMTIHGETPEEAGYYRWQSNEPNNGSQPLGEFCGVTHRNNALLHDAPCDWIMPFICEKSPTSLEDEDSSEIFE